MHTLLIFKVSLHLVLSSSTEWIWMMIASVMLTHPPARISAGRGMVSSWLVNLSLTKSFTWRKNKGKETQRRRRSQMRHNRSLDGRALMLTCGCSRILIAKCVSSSLHVFFPFTMNRSGQLFEHSKLRSGMTCREFDSFLRGNANELREETCKILFIDTIRIPDRERERKRDSLAGNECTFFFCIFAEWIHPLTARTI